MLNPEIEKSKQMLSCSISGFFIFHHSTLESFRPIIVPSPILPNRTLVR